MAELEGWEVVGSLRVRVALRSWKEHDLHRSSSFERMTEIIMDEMDSACDRIFEETGIKIDIDDMGWENREE